MQLKMIIHSNCTMMMMTIMIVTHFIYMNEHVMMMTFTELDIIFFGKRLKRILVSFRKIKLMNE